MSSGTFICFKSSLKVELTYQQSRNKFCIYYYGVKKKPTITQVTFSEILVQVFICIFLLVQMRAAAQKSVYIQAQHQNIFFYLPTSTHSFSNEMLNSVDFIGKLKRLKCFIDSSVSFLCFFLPVRHWQSMTVYLPLHLLKRKKFVL